jgi:hypothetical protein
LDPRFNWSFIKKDTSWDVDPETMSQRLAYTTREALADLDVASDEHVQFNDRQYIEKHGATITADYRKLWKLKFIDCWNKYRAELFPDMEASFVPDEVTAESLFLSFDSDIESPPPEDDQIDEEGLHARDVPAEVAKYFALSSISMNSNPLHWWKANENRYPVLASMARDILAIPASSAEPERVHSGARTVLNWNQSRMGPESIEASVTVKCYSSYNSQELDIAVDSETAVIQ